ncbi:MAG: hypothetical protein EAZ21_14805 [Betaproteobacteria bacterium]|nr:MAG: hypothetical protein EAZ21_14805 [Betaproteobacteria bacterium]
MPGTATPKNAPASSNPSTPSSIAAPRGDVSLIANLDPFASLALNTKFPLRGPSDGTVAKLRTIQTMTRACSHYFAECGGSGFDARLGAKAAVVRAPQGLRNNTGRET